MKEIFRNQCLVVWLGANIVGNKSSDRDLAQSNRSLLIHAEIRESGTAIDGAKGRHIVIVNSSIGAGHCGGGGGVVSRKKITAVGTM